MIVVRLLGSVDVLRDGVAHPVEGARRGAVLATLALNRGDVVSRDRIVDFVWDDEPPATSRNTIASHVSYLRRLLGDPGRIVAQPPGYRLALPPAGTDVEQAKALIARAGAVPEQAGVEGGAPPDPAVAGRTRPLARAVVGRHRGVHRLATRGRGARGEAGRGPPRVDCRPGAHWQHAEVLDEVAELAMAHPDHSLLVRAWMPALYRSGKREAAVAAFWRYEARLREDFGRPPPSKVTRLMHWISEGDRTLLRPYSPEPPPALATRSSPEPRPGGVRRSAAGTIPIIGRDGEIERFIALLRTGPVVTITGLGGVGKSRLAQEIAARLEGEGMPVTELDLSATAPDRLVSQVAGLLGVPSVGDEVNVAGLGAAVPPDGLLVIDSAPDVGADLGRLVVAVTRAQPNARVLITSRVPLHLPVESVVTLGPLSIEPRPGGGPSPAAELFLSRATQAEPGYASTTGVTERIEALARLTGGLPLALIIVAARLRSLTLSELIERLEARILTWPDERVGIDPRHRSLGAVLDATGDVLDPGHLEALMRLAHLRGGAWLTEAAGLASPDPSAGEDAIHALIDRSLVTRSRVGDRSWIEVHALVRLWALGRAEASDRARGHAGRHAWWAASTAMSSARHWHTASETDELRRRLIDRGNLDAALAWLAEHEPGAMPPLIEATWWSFYRSGQWREGVAWAGRTLDVVDPDVAGMASVAAVAGYLRWEGDDYDRAKAHAERALSLAGSDPAGLGFAEGVLARAVGDQGDFAGAAAHAERSVAAYLAAGDPWAVAWSRRMLASTQLYGGELALADQNVARARREFEAVADPWGLAGTLDLEGRVARELGERDRAVRVARRALAAHRACDDPSGERFALQHLAESCWAACQFEEAEVFATEALALCQEHRFPVGQLQACLLLADLARRRGDPAADEFAELADWPASSVLRPTSRSVLPPSGVGRAATVDHAGADTCAPVVTPYRRASRP